MAKNRFHATGGCAGICRWTDRYPQNEIPGFNDGPLLQRLPRCPAWLRRFEASTYAFAQRAPPDLVIKLQVGPETVVQREPQMVKSIIDQRIAWLNELTFSSTRIVSIDATRPLEEVHRKAKHEIWVFSRLRPVMKQTRAKKASSRSPRRRPAARKRFTALASGHG